MKHAIAIIGAGIAGLACARRLSDAGRAVVVFDKGRSPGGRMATRRVDTAAGPARFDHGAQYFTARDPAFQAALATFEASLSAWPGDLATLEAGAVHPMPTETRLVGAPAMNALPKAMAQGLDVRLSTQIAALEWRDGVWRLHGAEGPMAEPYAAVLVATPAEQAQPLLAPHDQSMAAEAASAETAPCWAGLFAFAVPTPTPFTAMRLADHPILAWIACDSAKPGRNEGIVCRVAHARPDWSRANLERTPDEVAGLLGRALVDLLKSPVEPILALAHRWRYAQVARPAPTPFAWNQSLGLGACGDWRIGPRIECAWRSGWDLAGATLQEQPHPLA